MMSHTTHKHNHMHTKQHNVFTPQHHIIQGLPLPSQEFNAIDVVVRYAVSGLGFALEDVILFAWSIGMSLYTTLTFNYSFVIHLNAHAGGYTASCAAMSYPDIGAVVSCCTLPILVLVKIEFS